MRTSSRNRKHGQPRLRSVVVGAALALGLVAIAQTPPRTLIEPKAGSPLRKALLDAVREHYRKDLNGKPVVFSVTHMRVQGNDAFLTAVPQQPNGKAFDYRGTKFQSAIDAGVFDNWVATLLRYDAKTKKWRVRQSVLGATDVAWVGWWNEFKVPVQIFPVKPGLDMDGDGKPDLN